LFRLKLTLKDLRPAEEAPDQARSTPQPMSQFWRQFAT